MSDTPSTDANMFSATTEKPTSGDYELEVVYSDFARKLERDNVALRAEIKRIATENAILRSGIEDWSIRAHNAESKCAKITECIARLVATDPEIRLILGLCWRDGTSVDEPDIKALANLILKNVHG